MLPPQNLTRTLAFAWIVSSIGLAQCVPSTARAVPSGPAEAAAGSGTTEAGEPASDDDAGCGPFEGTREFAQLGPSQEPGVAPVEAEPGAGGGQIVNLPAAAERPAGQVLGEAILALPKGSSREFKLSDDAHLAESYFSPVLCATVARIAGPPDASPEELVPEYPDTAALVPNHVYTTADAEITPLEAGPARPDPYRSLQWGLEQSGAEEARGVSDGGGVRVAVLDSLPQTDHKDLGPIQVSRVEGGPGEAPGAHGTLVTGLLDATPGNGFGIAGIAPGADIVAIPVCTPAGATASDTCPLFTVLRGLDAAWTERASVVNLSIVGPENPLLARGMERLDELGVLVVAAAGNEGTREPRYPAAYPSVIGVGAHDRSGVLYARSNRAPSAELLAPGVEVLSTVPGDAFSFGSGTSFAAAHVTGTLAILLGAHVDPDSARTALFQLANASRGSAAEPPRLPPVCAVLARLDRPCP